MPIVLCTPFPFFTLCDAMLTMLVCATHWLSMHLYMLGYMSMHECCLLVCRPYFNTMKLWTSNSNLHLSPVDTTFCFSFFLFFFFLVFMFACFLSCFLACLFILWLAMSPAICCACHIYLACLLCTLCALSMYLFLSISCFLVSYFCRCMYTYGTRMYGARASSPKCKQKGRRCKYIDISQAAMFSSFRGLASPIWLCTRLKPLPSSFHSLLDGLY